MDELSSSITLDTAPGDDCWPTFSLNRSYSCCSSSLEETDFESSLIFSPGTSGSSGFAVASGGRGGNCLLSCFGTSLGGSSGASMPSRLAIGRDGVRFDCTGESRSASESLIVFVACEVCRVESNVIVEFRRAASSVLELSPVGLGIGTGGNAFKIESPSRLLFATGEVDASGVLSCPTLRCIYRSELGSSGSGPEGGGKGGGKSVSVGIVLPAINHEARFNFGFPDAVELLRFLEFPSI